MKKIYITDNQFDALKAIAVSQNVRISTLVQIAVNIAFHPIVYTHLDYLMSENKHLSIKK